MKIQKMDEGVYHEIENLVYNELGIRLGPHKKIMVESRLNRRLMVLNMNDFHTYMQLVRSFKGEKQELFNAVTTHKTDFFRERDHFNFLNEIILPEFVKSDKKTLFIWSAACSSGEEAYSVGMMADYYFRTDITGLGCEKTLRILGTDVDTQVLWKATQGIYPANLVHPIPPHLLKNYFLFNKEKDLYKVVEHLKRFTKFRQFNLITGNFPMDLKFDIIFLRNVLIYFDNESIQTVINKMESYLSPGGHFFIGHAESLTGIEHKMDQIDPSIFRKKKSL